MFYISTKSIFDAQKNAVLSTAREVSVLAHFINRVNSVFYIVRKKPFSKKRQERINKYNYTKQQRVMEQF